MSKKIANAAQKASDSQTRGAFQALVEESFNDFYAHRRQVYAMNFVRGVFFGLGSALGGTLMVALVLWTLSFFVQLPLIGDYASDAKNTIQRQ